jgi:hypothetical protein
MRAIPGVLTAMFLAAAAGTVPATANADVIIEGPRVVIPEPEFLVPIPGPVGVYYYAAPDADVFYLDGWWWMADHGRWYRASGWNGPWAFVAPRHVPRHIGGLGPDVRGRYWHRDHRVPWHEWRTRHYRPAAPPPAYVPRHYYGRDRAAPPPRVDRHAPPRHDGHYDRHDNGRGRGHDKDRGRGHDKPGKPGKGGKGGGHGKGHGPDRH